MKLVLTFYRITVFLVILSFTGINTHGQSIEVMSYNIRFDNPNDGENWWHHRKDEVVNLIEFYHPDFIGIQEGLYNQVTFINDHTSNYNYIGVGRDDGMAEGEYTAIYFDSSKFELVKTTTFWLSESPDSVSVGWDASMERICTYGNFVDKQTNNEINIFNTHFDHIGPEARKKSAQLILSKIEQYGLGKSSIIVMGDFNCDPQSIPIQYLKKKLRDSIDITRKRFYGPHGTYNGFDINAIPNRRIDYIFTSKLRVTSYRHIDDKRKNSFWVSDHLPVIIEVLFN